MAWLDDRIRDHPKVSGLSDRAFRVWILGLCYSSAHSTGGRVDDGISINRWSKAGINELVSAGLWELEDDGMWIHDWADYNEKRDEREDEKRAQARERAKKHRQKVRDERVTRTRDVTRDASVTPSRARAGAPLNDQDHDQGSRHDPEDQKPSVLPSVAKDPPPEPQLEPRNGRTDIHEHSDKMGNTTREQLAIARARAAGVRL